LRTLSPRFEFFLVIVIGLGLPIVSSLWSALHPVAGPHHTGGTLIGLIVYELVILLVLASFLRSRGWSLKKLGFEFSLADIGLGLLLFVVWYVVYAAMWFCTEVLSPQAAGLILGAHIVAQNIAVPTVISVSIINPIFEESIVSGYVISALKDRYGLWHCTNVSVALRLLYHLDQGPIAVIGVIPLGLIFGQWFVRTGRLWPLIVAHALGDFLPLMMMRS
jgi:membrane protease YdiL (CAAX protease family)